MPRFAVYPDVPAMLLDDAVARRQPQAGALAQLLGGEERLEEMLLRVSGLMPVPVSLTRQHDYAPGVDARVGAGA